MGSNQWYLHFSRHEEASGQPSVAAIKSAVKEFRAACDAAGINAVVGFGPGLLPELTDDVPADFQSYGPFESIDGSGRLAKATQEELLVWINHDDKGKLWQAQYDVRNALDAAGMRLARETPTFIYGESQDLSGFIDGTGNPEAERDQEVGIVPDGEPGAGGSHIIAQRWIHDLKGFHALPLEEQEGVFGRTKADSTRLAVQPAHSHLSHVELREGATADDSKPKRDEITRRSTPYAFPAPPTGGDGVNGLYFIGFCKNQAPLRERMQAMYGMDGQVRDRLTDFSNPASGSFYFAPSTEVLDSF
jgi:putative iron-dependent peroxidase